MTSPQDPALTSYHDIGTSNPGFSDGEGSAGVCSILKHEGDTHSNQNSVRFKANESDLDLSAAGPGAHESSEDVERVEEPQGSNTPYGHAYAKLYDNINSGGQNTENHYALPQDVVVNVKETEEPRLIMSERDVEDTLERIRQNFSQYLDRDMRISEQNFKAALGPKAKSFFVDRFFWFLDTDHNGYVDMSELTQAARVLLSGTTSEKVNFVFTLFDISNSGNLEKKDMKTVLTSGVRECKMKLKDTEIETLIEALYDQGDIDRDGFFTRADMTRMLEKYPHALDSLTHNAAIWLQPREKQGWSPPCAKWFSKRYVTNNAQRVAFVVIFWLLNGALFCLNAYLYRDKNEWIVFARGCAMIVNFNSILVILLPLRNSITFLRSTFLYRVLPLDHNVNLHKMVGMTLFVFSVLHSGGQIGNAVYLSDQSNMTIPEIVFTREADMGWILGLAPVTGLVLLVILVVMVVASRPCVRRTGHFQIFYWTHKLYFLYVVLCVIHAENFWKYIVLPVVIFLVDKIISYVRRSRGTVITSVCLLPSEVTQLNILKPRGFSYRPGDYVHIKIPAIAQYEYHPFTISSPPEKGDHFSVHIRSAGNWTNRLREFLLSHTLEPGTRNITRGRYSSIWDGARTSVARKKIASIKARTVSKDVNLKVYVDGPYGSPCRNIFETEHAILIGSGIGATPFASILQSITCKFKASQVTCPHCHMSWCPAPQGLTNLRKVDFVWINRDQVNFEWFTTLLTRIERDMAKEASLQDAITMHMFMTGAPSQYEIHGVGLQMALDMVRDAKSTDLITGLTTRTQGGRPDFDKLFFDIKKKSPCSKLKVFFCGNPALAKTIRRSCMKLDIDFSKEQF